MTTTQTQYTDQDGIRRYRESGDRVPTRVRVSGVEARLLPTDESWQVAAARAARRIVGSRSAEAWRWNSDGYASDGSYANYRATIVGPKSRHGGGFPVLAEVVARVEWR